MTYVLETSELTCGYDAEPVVRGLNVRVAKGEWIGIVGPNGSGKSTVLRMLARLLAPSSGEVLLDGTNMA